MTDGKPPAEEEVSIEVEEEEEEVSEPESLNLNLNTDPDYSSPDYLELKRKRNARVAKRFKNYNEER